MSENILIEALKFIFPAYCANAVPVIFGGGKPLDLGKNLPDGKPVFGKNKTFKGFFAGLIVGTLVGLGETLVFHFPLTFGFLLSLGALLGDLAGAFLKRRLGFEPGAKLLIADQLDFVFGAFLFSVLVLPPSLIVMFVVVLITPPIHLSTNYIAYKLGVKSKPW